MLYYVVFTYIYSLNYPKSRQIVTFFVLFFFDTSSMISMVQSYNSTNQTKNGFESRSMDFRIPYYQWAKFGRLPGLIHPSFNCIIGHVAIHSTGRDLESRVEKVSPRFTNRENAGNNLSRVILKLANIYIIYIYAHIYVYI